MKNIKKIADDIYVQKYFDWVGKFNKGQAKQKIQELELQISKTLAAAERACNRHDDCGPMDMASERLEPVYNKVELLKWYLKNPSKKPPFKLMEVFKEKIESQEENKKERDEARQQFEKFPNLVGKQIYWKSEKNRGEMMNGIVAKQKLGRDGKPRYKTVSNWTVPHRLVKKVVTPRNQDKILKNLEKEKVKIKEKKESFKIGQMVEWNSRKCYDPSGKIVGIGRTKLKVQTKSQSKGQWWNVPIKLVTKVNGKKI